VFIKPEPTESARVVVAVYDRGVGAEGQGADGRNLAISESGGEGFNEEEMTYHRLSQQVTAERARIGASVAAVEG
jgi:hypothetical protein